ncbi:hypothetical protein SADUNF_Sadunf06G0055000 [Salix dunnii]|uniref:Srp40 C-terminal domain-containing protein n=1 Tax=Salix dunnii TaxID=1413687 RepID=A0A835MUX2_9ROSI|nr:hypothetical protein SADUNF_Sadunf06G0055000 [Salix dunnii]
MSKAPVANTVNINPNLLSFKPRQLLLLSNRAPAMKQEINNTKSHTLKPEQKTVLLHSIANYLENTGGFSKTLKKLKSEAKLEKEDLGGGSLIDLEEVFCKFLKTRDNTFQKFESSQVQDIQMNDFTKKKKKSDTDAINKKLGAADKVDNYESVEEILTSDTVSIEVKPKEKNKKNKNSDSHGQEEQYSTEALKEPADNVAGESPDKKHKDKKKKKSSLESESKVANGGQEPVATEEKSKDVAPSEGNNVAVSETENKPKDKKKKKNKLSDADADSNDNKNVKSEGRKKRKNIVVSENMSVETFDEGKSNKVDSEKDDSKNSKEDVNDKEDKKSKKRKRLPSEDDATQPADEKAVEDSKRRKMDSSEEPKENGQANGNFEKNGEKSSVQKSMKKEKNGSVETGTMSLQPKTVKHFQRVKVDEVVFSDERLKDNSYWAKAGAEDGYGAKAQDILGQVRGRDFRHEKTKKKRGTYRGGQIDLQSHSVKFNYSDED